MAELTDAQLVEFMLDARRNGVETAHRRYSKKQWRRWFSFVAMIGVMVAVGVACNVPAFAAFSVGLGVGVLWMYYEGRKQSAAAWRFYAQVIDWAKVEQFAAEKTTNLNVT